MSQGTLALTNGSNAVTGTGTAFTADVEAGGFVVFYIGDMPFTLVVDAVSSATSFTLMEKFDGPTTSGVAYSGIPRRALNTLPMELAQQARDSLTRLRRNDMNFQQLLTVDGDVTIKRPDGTDFNGPAWPKVIRILEASDVNDIAPLAAQVRADATQVRADATQVAADKTAAETAKNSAEVAASSATTAKDSAVSANASAQQAKTDAVAAKTAAEAAAGSIDTSALLRKDGNLAGLTDKPTARLNLELGSAATANIGGVVSMGGDGRPNGSILEHGSNANGRYTKFADGTMICWFTGTTAVSVSIASGSLYRSGTQTLTFPAAFISPPTVVPSVKRTGTAEVAWGVCADPTTTNVAVFGYSGASTTVNVGYVATGRWV